MQELLLRSLQGLHIEALYLVGSFGWEEEDFAGPFQLLLGLSDNWLLDVEASSVGEYLQMRLTQGQSRAQVLASARSPGLWGPQPVLPGHELAPLLGQRITGVRLAHEQPEVIINGLTLPTTATYDKVLQLFTPRNTLTLLNEGFLFTGLDSSLTLTKKSYIWTELL
jgi:hypothetical protein